LRHDARVPQRLTDAEYRRLLEFRTGLRRFLRWSEEQAAAVGLTPQQHQLLLAIRGLPGAPAVGDVADALLLRHHSAVELVDRAERAGLVERVQEPDDQRVTRLRLTREGARRLHRLSRLHLEELGRLAPSVQTMWEGLGLEHEQ
jgi:DNA-binding MarR family transcriptional regulator